MISTNVATTITGVTDLRIGVESGTGHSCLIIDTVGGKHYITLETTDPFSCESIKRRVMAYNQSQQEEIE